MAEFTANNHTSQTTGHSPFYSNSGFHPRMAFGQHPLQDPKNIREVNTQQIYFFIYSSCGMQPAGYGR
jgi:hypothetical protein